MPRMDPLPTGATGARLDVTLPPATRAGSGAWNSGSTQTALVK
jgi:hypothetical protein